MGRRPAKREGRNPGSRSRATRERVPGLCGHSRQGRQTFRRAGGWRRRRHGIGLGVVGRLRRKTCSVVRWHGGKSARGSRVRRQRRKGLRISRGRVFRHGRHSGSLRRAVSPARAARRPRRCFRSLPERRQARWSGGRADCPGKGGSSMEGVVDAGVLRQSRECRCFSLPGEGFFGPVPTPHVRVLVKAVRQAAPDLQGHLLRDQILRRRDGEFHELKCRGVTLDFDDPDEADRGGTPTCAINSAGRARRSPSTSQRPRARRAPPTARGFTPSRGARPWSAAPSSTCCRCSARRSQATSSKPSPS